MIILAVSIRVQFDFISFYTVDVNNAHLLKKTGLHELSNQQLTRSKNQNDLH